MLTFVFKLLVNDSKQQQAALDGLEYIAGLTRRYAEIEHLFLQNGTSRLANDLKRGIVQLYKHVLEYQARATCQFKRRAALQIIRNIGVADGWETILADIKQAETRDDLRRSSSYWRNKILNLMSS